MSEILTKIKSTADILGGSVFFANDLGQDPEFAGAELLPNGMYIRLEGSDGSLAYISAHEIDKAIGIIGQMTMSKASQAKVDEIIELLDEKVSKTEIDLLRTEINNKVNDDDFNDLTGLVSNKAERSELENVKTSLLSKADNTDIDELIDIIDSKVDVESFNELSDSVAIKTSDIINIKNDIRALQDVLGNVSDSNSITAIQNQINYLNSELNKKLTIDDLSGLKNSVNSLNDYDTELTERISSVETNLNKKASTIYVQGQVNELNNAITGISIRVDSKADKETVAKKASISDFNALTAKVTSLSNEFNDTKNEFESLNNNIYAELDKKVDSDSLNNQIENLEELLNDKVDKTIYADGLGRLENKIITHETACNDAINTLAANLDEFECETNNSLSEIRATINSHSIKNEDYREQIKDLQETDAELEEKLRMQWVRVMTPEEYKKLAPIGDTFLDGTPNPYAKQANTVYMLVRYNKPIAVYIGDILIAQAEQKGSIGFAYTFPIIFQ